MIVWLKKATRLDLFNIILFDSDGLERYWDDKEIIESILNHLTLFLTRGTYIN